MQPGEPGRTFPAVAAALALLLAACGSDSVTAPVKVERPATSLAEFEARLEVLRTGLKVPGMAAAIAGPGGAGWARGFGQADAERTVPATPTTSFHLASLTKTFAAFIVMQLMEEGRLDLDRPVEDFGINLPQVRVRHLLTHTSDSRPPGSAYRYNGDRYALLSSVIERAGGRPFSRLVSERIILPLALAETAPNVRSPEDFNYTGYDPVAFERNLARAYGLGGNGAVLPLSYPSLFSPAAGLISSARDMIRYSDAIDRDRLVSPATQAQMFTPSRTNSGDPIPYGLGWFVQSFEGTRLVWHYGFWTGNSSLIIKVPERGLTFVVLANSDGLSRDVDLAAGDVRVSPVAAEFLAAFVTGHTPLS